MFQLAIFKKKKNRHLRAIELEKNLSQCRRKSSLASKAWKKILQDVGIETSPACDSVFQHVFQHFWSITGSVVEKESIQTRSTVHQADHMESEAATDHAGWAIKGARDIINSSEGNHLSVKKSPMASDAGQIDKLVALELIARLGNDEKQENGYFRFVSIREVRAFSSDFMMLWTICCLRTSLLWKKTKLLQITCSNCQQTRD